MGQFAPQLLLRSKVAGLPAGRLPLVDDGSEPLRSANWRPSDDANLSSADVADDGIEVDRKPQFEAWIGNLVAGRVPTVLHYEEASEAVHEEAKALMLSYLAGRQEPSPPVIPASRRNCVKAGK